MSIRVLVADDSLTVRKRIAQALSHQPEFEVVGEATDGRQAVDLCRKLRPDVLTLDMAMPVLSGLDATAALMAVCPTPILIVSSSTNRGDLFKTYEALAAGAVDVLEKSPGDEDKSWDQRLASALRVVAQVKLVTRFRPITRPAPRVAPSAAMRRGVRAVGLGASTGGPGAVAALLKALPRDFPAPILLVLHLAPGFGTALADWLRQQSSLPTSFALDGQILPPLGRACVLLAPPDLHMTLHQGRLVLDLSLI